MRVFVHKNAGAMFVWGVFLLLILVDQFTKGLVTYPFRNYRFAFSIPLSTWFIYPVYGLVLTVIILYVVKNYHYFNRPSQLSWVFILAGAASNIGERIALGYVRDFIYITFWRWTGIYNLADFYIIFGVILLLWNVDRRQAG